MVKTTNQVSINHIIKSVGIRAFAAGGIEPGEAMYAPVRMPADDKTLAVDTAMSAVWDGSREKPFMARGTHIVAASMKLVDWVMYSSFEDKATSEPD